MCVKVARTTEHLHGGRLFVARCERRISEIIAAPPRFPLDAVPLAIIPQGDYLISRPECHYAYVTSLDYLYYTHSVESAIGPAAVSSLRILR